MKVLLFEDNVPKKPGSGGHVATHALIDFLRERSSLHIVNIVSNPSLDPLDGPDVTVFRRREGGGLLGRVQSLMSSEPKMVAEVDWDALLKQIAPYLSSDCFVLGSARFLGLADRLPGEKYYIADNVEWELALAMESNYRSPALAKLDAGRIRTLEARGIAAMTGACAFTRRDADTLSALSGRPVEVIPPILPPANRPVRSREAFAFYPTNMEHPPNVDALEWLLSKVWPKRKSDWRLVVTGAGDFSRFSSAYPDVDFRGFVSREELADLYDRAAVVLNPTRTGSGFQIKLLEALSYGCNVVSTGFSNPLGDKIRSSDDPAEFAALVYGALASPGTGGFDYAALYAETCSKLEIFLGLRSQGS